MPYDSTEKHNILIRWKVPTQLLTNTFEIYLLNDFMISLPCIQFISQPLDRDQ